MFAAIPVEIGAVGQAANHHQRARIAGLRGKARHLRQRQPDVGEVDKADAVGHDADDRRGLRAVHPDRAPQHIASCPVAALPDIARNERDGFGAGTIVGSGEVATELGLDAEHGKSSGGHIKPVKLLGRRAVASQTDCGDRERGRRAIKSPRVAAPILEVAVRHAGLSAAGIHRPHDRDAIGPLEREVAPQRRVRADERRVRHAHREREREDGAGRRPSVPEENATGKSHVCR